MSCLLNFVCQVTRPPPHTHTHIHTYTLFLKDDIKMNGIPSKIKWKIHICSTLYFKFWRYFLETLTRYCYQFLCLLLFYISRYHFYNILALHSTLWKKIFATNYPCLTDSVGDPFNDQNPLSLAKFFCWCSLTFKILNVWDVLIPTKNMNLTFDVL